MVALVCLPSVDGSSYCRIPAGSCKDISFLQSFHSERPEHLSGHSLSCRICIDGFSEDAEKGVEDGVCKRKIKDDDE